MTTPISCAESVALLALAERVEGLACASKPVDRAIRDALGLGNDYAADWGARGHDVPTAFPYTASVDAAMTLVPEGAHATGERFRLEHWNDSGVYPEHIRASAWVPGAARVYAATPAIALTAAALRARASEQPA